MKFRSKLNHMLRKLLACWNLALLLVAFSRCDRCTTNPVENITKWELVWDKAVALGNLLPSSDVAKGIVFRVPSEDAVCFLEPMGVCSKFTQASEGRTYLRAHDKLPQHNQTRIILRFSGWLHPGTEFVCRYRKRTNNNAAPIQRKKLEVCG